MGGFGRGERAEREPTPLGRAGDGPIDRVRGRVHRGSAQHGAGEPSGEKGEGVGGEECGGDQENAGQHEGRAFPGGVDVPEAEVRAAARPGADGHRDEREWRGHERRRQHERGQPLREAQQQEQEASPGGGVGEAGTDSLPREVAAGFVVEGQRADGGPKQDVREDTVEAGEGAPPVHGGHQQRYSDQCHREAAGDRDHRHKGDEVGEAERERQQQVGQVEVGLGAPGNGEVAAHEAGNAAAPAAARGCGRFVCGAAAEPYICHDRFHFRILRVRSLLTRWCGSFVTLDRRRCHKLVTNRFGTQRKSG